jgi:6-phosphofructokinase 1
MKEIMCEPSTVKAAIATIGEICPGKNVVIRSIVKCLEQDYGVSEIYGIKWGFRGFCEEFPKHW